MVGMKLCSGPCEEVKDVSEFHTDRRGRVERLRARCKACMNQSNKDWHRRNPGKCAQYSMKHNTENRDSRNEQQRNRVQENPAQRKRVAERFKDSHPEASAEYSKKYRETHPEKVTENAHTRRARKYGGEYDRGISISKLFVRDGDICYLCDETIDRSLSHPDKAAATVEHVRPLSKGGLHVWDNVKLAHGSCNFRKGDKLL